MQGLIAKYWCLQGKNVTIVEPNETLRYQTAEKLGLVDFGITVITIDQYYEYGSEDNIIMLNEYD